MYITLDLSPVVHRKAGLATYTKNIAAHVLQAAVEQALPDIHFSAFHYDHIVKEPLQAPLNQLPCQTVAWPARRWRLTVALRTFIGMAMDEIVLGRPIFPHSRGFFMPPSICCRHWHRPKAYLHFTMLFLRCSPNIICR